MGRLRTIAKRVPGLPWLYRAATRVAAARRLRSVGAERLFTEIYRRNAWRGAESVSGTGSDAGQTAVITGALTDLIRERSITSILDIPCGDFAWMQHVDLTRVRYTGADIVEDLVRENNARCAGGDLAFLHLDLVRDTLPGVDLVLCRDCLVHFSFDDALRALRNVCLSRARYLLSTTYPEQPINRDIATGQWRVLNLELPPFSLPEPLRLINEGCTEEEGDYRDKSLGLWLVDDVRARIC